MAQPNKNEKDGKNAELANQAPAPEKREEPKAAAKEEPKGAGEAPRAAEAAPAKKEPAWSQDTWVALSNVKLGVPPFVVAGALWGTEDGEVFTEVDVRRRLKAFLEQSVRR